MLRLGQPAQRLTGLAIDDVGGQAIAGGRDSLDVPQLAAIGDADGAEVFGAAEAEDLCPDFSAAAGVEAGPRHLQVYLGVGGADEHAEDVPKVLEARRERIVRAARDGHLRFAVGQQQGGQNRLENERAGPGRADVETEPTGPDLARNEGDLLRADFRSGELGAADGCGRSDGCEMLWPQARPFTSGADIGDANGDRERGGQAHTGAKNLPAALALRSIDDDRLSWHGRESTLPAATDQWSTEGSHQTVAGYLCWHAPERAAASGGRRPAGEIREAAASDPRP